MSSWEIKNRIRKRLAEEEGVLRKIAPLNVALCHPATYEVAMSSLGFQAIYQEIHKHLAAAAERAFLPDNPEEYRRNRVPVFTYENERPLSDFPIIAFSIAYELEITGIFEMLDLCGIPLLRGETGRKHKLHFPYWPPLRQLPIICIMSTYSDRKPSAPRAKFDLITESCRIKPFFDVE